MAKTKPQLFYILFAMLAFFVVFITAIFIFHTVIAERIDFFVSSSQEYKDTIHIRFDAPENFFHNVERAHFSNRGVEPKFYQSRAELITLDPIEIPQKNIIADITEYAEIPTGTSVFYQISPDNERWYYYNGTNWSTVDDCNDCVNTADDLRQAFSATSVTGNIHIKIILVSNQRNRPLIHSIDFLLAKEKANTATVLRSAISTVMRTLVRAFDTLSIAPVYAQEATSTTQELPENPQTTSTPTTTLPIQEGSVQTTTSLKSTIQTSTPEETPLDLQEDTTQIKENKPKAKKDKPPETNVYPLLECVSDNGDSSYTAYFGYNSEYTDSVDISVGPNNKFSPNPQDRGQVTTFSPGQTDPYPQYAFSTVFFEKKITWTIKAPDGKNQKVDATSDGSSPACPSNWDGSDLIVSGECVPPFVRFTVTNAGDGDMAGTGVYRIYRNDALEDVQTLPMLVAGASTTVDVAADGSPVSIQVDQRPDHPAGGFVNARVEGCEPQQPPTVFDDAVETRINTPVTIDVLANDTDADGTIDESTLAITEEPLHGAALITTSTDGQIVYTPETDYYGSDTFTYQVCDNDGLCDAATVEIFILVPPSANDDTISAIQGEEKILSILGNDTDVDGVLIPGSLQITASSTHGFAAANTVSGTIAYAPDDQFYGQDALEYQICDDDGLCDTATVSITILAPPIALNDNTAAVSGQAKNIDILLNDTDPDGLIDPESLSMIESPLHGNAIVNNGLIIYTSTNGYSGEDTFVYQICDTDTLCDEANVFITVVKQDVEASGEVGGGLALFPPNASPDTGKTRMNTSIELNILANDFDPDNTLNPLSLALLVEPTHGQAIANTSSGIISYTPTRDFFGTDTLTYIICDITNLCTNATVNVVVLAPPVAYDDAASAAPDATQTISVVSNDIDPDGTLNTDSLRILQAPGEYFDEAAPFSLPEHGSATVQSDGTISYVPNAAYVGNDQFFYEICDNDGLCDTAMVRVSVGQPAPPVAQPDRAIVQQGNSVTVPLTQNDQAINGTLLLTTLSLISLPEHGSATLDTTNGTLRYTADTDYLGEDALVYRICDSIGLCSQGTVSISIGPKPVERTISSVPQQAPPSLFIGSVTLPTVTELTVSPEIRVLPDICGARFTDETFAVGGTFTGDPNTIRQFEYSITDGVSWNPIGAVQIASDGASLSVPFSDLQSKKYVLRMRAILDDGTAITSEGCPFTVDRGLVVASVQYLSEETGTTPIHIEDATPLRAGERQDVFLEAKGADRVTLTVEQTGETIPLSYNKNIKLWQGNFRFDVPGEYRLSVEAQSDIATYKRDLNTLVVRDVSNIESTDGTPIDDVIVSIYRQDPNTGVFSVWDEASIQTQNPLLTGKNISRIFPPDVYIEADKNGYATKTSRIFTLDRQSLISTNIILEQQTISNAINTFLPDPESDSRLPFQFNPQKM